MVFRPVAPGEEIILHLGPLDDILTQVMEIFYPISVAGTIVIPSCDTVYNMGKMCRMVKEVKPTLVCGSAKMYEKMFHKLRSLQLSMSRLRKMLLDTSGTGSALTKLPHKLSVNVAELCS